MARVKGGVHTKARHKKVLKKAAGHRGARSRIFTRANTSVMKSLQYAYVGRRLKKRDMRALWIQRINAAARMNGTKYSELQNWLNKAAIGLDRRVLANIAVHHPADFGQIVETAKHLAAGSSAQ
jgi:large subunit ribosomal protein L20